MTVYVLSLHGSGPYKIGHTDAWRARLSSYRSHAYRVDVLLLDHDAGLFEEQALHQRFRSKKAPHPTGRLEWFFLDQDDLSQLEAALVDAKAERQRLLSILDGSNREEGREG